MKTINLIVAGNTDEVSFLKGLIEKSPSREVTYTIGDVRSAIKIIEKLEAMPEGGDLIIEDADHAWLKRRLHEQRWIVANSEILQFVDKVGA